jgi:transcriptional regulator GlxA family with amidase domain
MPHQAPLRVGIIGYEGANALDIAGPAEAFCSAYTDQRQAAATQLYQVVLIGLTRRPFTTDSGIVLQPRCAFSNAPELDTLIVPGGSGIRKPEIGLAVGKWVRQRSGRTRRIVSICTGAYGLAQSGLLDGRTVTTHWRFAKDLAGRFPALNVNPTPLFLRDGKFYTSAGVAAGIDLALALIEEDWGRRIALAAARDMVVYLKRPGGQEQFSEPLQFQIQAADRFNEIATWIVANLQRDLSVESLAARASLCPRHFRRRFKTTFGKNPASFVEGLRLGEVRRRLTTTGQTVEAIAASLGFNDADSLRRVFRRRFGVAPGDYRNRFQSSRRPGAARGALP